VTRVDEYFSGHAIGAVFVWRRALNENNKPDRKDIHGRSEKTALRKFDVAKNLH
jgi:hypothetical protein